MTSNNITFTNNGKRVTIATPRVEYALNNNLPSEPLSIPTTDTTNSNPTKISNLLRIIERYVINGYIVTGMAPNGSSPVERTNAMDVKEDLIGMAKRREVTIMNYEGTDYSVTFEKLSIKEQAMDIGDEAPSGVIRYDIQCSVVVGEALF